MSQRVHPLAGKPAPRSILVNVPRLMTAYYALHPDPEQADHRIVFGTAGHRGSALHRSFNERHILAAAQAICDYRREAGIDGPLFLGMDTHALSEAAQTTALEVLAANGVEVMVEKRGGYTPTPVVSFSILKHNRGRTTGLADGIVVTPSHNPPGDGGFKYDPPHGGAAESVVTRRIEDAANAHLRDECRRVKRMTFARAIEASTTHHFDFAGPYIEELGSVIDMDAICSAGITLGVDPLGGSGLRYWDQVARRYSIEIDVVNDLLDPTFSFMTVDRDGKIRMDCSSPYAMRRLIKLKDRFDVSVASDPDHDRHGIVTHTTGLLNPNHYLAVAAWYLSLNRRLWPKEAAIAKTLVSSSMIDRVAKSVQRSVVEMPVGFKWFVHGLLEGRYGFAGEESAGASFLRQDGTVWTTDKDGILLGLLAAEITAKTGLDPGEHYRRLTKKYGEPVYERIDARASVEQKTVLKRLVPETIPETTLAGEPILAKLNAAPGNGELIGGVKIVTENGWFAVRPSGTENIYKLYAESFLGPEHVRRIQEEAQLIIERAFEDAHVDAAMPVSISATAIGAGGTASLAPGGGFEEGAPLDVGDGSLPPDPEGGHGGGPT
ncbi:MAG: alpha-D-glucose phosphate-specific phosphoglucomutase [Polyangiaceae bacterium]|nr:alpha-D-glucose phosphate-specific phosphoglucomutase [Polyangiaceae bacterium]